MRDRDRETEMSTLDMLQLDQSWTNSTLLDALTTVLEYEESQVLWRVLILNKDDISIVIMWKYLGQGRV